MTMEKLKMHSPDLSQENIAKIRDLFPGCVTEARDEATGQVRLAVDFDQLRQELSEHIVEGPQERYRLEWPGKREALALANAPIAKTLRPCVEDSVDFDGTKNLYLEGDNLEALKILQESYLGQVDLAPVDGFDQDETASEGDEAAVVFCRFLATQSNTFETLELTHGLLDPGTGLVEPFREKRRFVLRV
jgi:hypothetical protein